LAQWHERADRIRAHSADRPWTIRPSSTARRNAPEFLSAGANAHFDVGDLVWLMASHLVVEVTNMDIDSVAAESAGTPIALTLRQVVALSGVSRSSVYMAIGAGELRCKKLGRRTIVRFEDFRAWLDSLPDLRPRNGIVTGPVPRQRDRVESAGAGVEQSRHSRRTALDRRDDR
jgi:excisionase family DNA binding protein